MEIPPEAFTCVQRPELRQTAVSQGFWVVLAVEGGRQVEQPGLPVWSALRRGVAQFCHRLDSPGKQGAQKACVLQIAEHAAYPGQQPRERESSGRVRISHGCSVQQSGEWGALRN
ncbi:hypothetical protein AAFF_G00111190 [Aldrovandia affinis]|uniref:Uncharacterized protein n=1 Tax=Aldrovandia affinis TaxID=143900 RepID=A0AAD7WB52_9TELE|nr:hypothetical protein AAFF_G00111190 [Aldrovandia affinis]